MTESIQQTPIVSGRWSRRVERWSRLSRIVLTMMITTLLIAALWLVITLVAGLHSSSNAVLRMVIILGGGVVVYVYGWSVLVGFDESPTTNWHASPQTLGYLLAGLIALIFNIVMLLIGLVAAGVV